jgi:hypothetical protein
MLTPTDVHFLVGLLTQISRPEGVDIELGDMVFDSVAEEERDVDITVRVTSDTGTTSAFEGIEVKHHKRPLDITHVEQLCAKLNDMPAITTRGIVSGSGYTRPAVRKAIHNKVDLYDIRDWQAPMKLGKITLSEELKIDEGKYQWIGSPRVTLISSLNRPKDSNMRFEPSAPVFDSQGVQLVETPTCEALIHSLASRSIALAEKQGKSLKMAVDEPKSVTFNITLENQPFTIVGEKKIPLSKAIISGEIKYIETVITPKYKGLYKHGDQQPFVGCAIFEMSYGNLAGFTVDPSNTLRFINIPVADRLIKKIYRLPL